MTSWSSATVWRRWWRDLSPVPVTDHSTAATRLLVDSRPNAAVRTTTYTVTLRDCCGAVYCNRPSLWVCVGNGWVCYRDNSKLRASILTKLGL